VSKRKGSVGEINVSLLCPYLEPSEGVILALDFHSCLRELAYVRLDCNAGVCTTARVEQRWYSGISEAQKIAHSIFSALASILSPLRANRGRLVRYYLVNRVAESPR
jgi:hypothetical protein